MSSKCTAVKDCLATDRDFHTCSFLFGSPEALISSTWREPTVCLNGEDHIWFTLMCEVVCVHMPNGCVYTYMYIATILDVWLQALFSHCI